MDDDFFPPETVDTHADWFAAYLRAMEEHPLYPPSPDGLTTFRCLCLPTWDRPSVVRIQEHGLTWRMSGRQTNGDGGFEIGTIDRRVERTLLPGESDQIHEMLTRLQFWDRPTALDDDGLDGTTWVIEGVDRRRYHVAHRWMPEWGDTFGDFGRLLLTLCDFGDGASWGV